MIYKTLGDFVTLSQGLAINSETKHLVNKEKNEEFIYPLLRIADMMENHFTKYISKDVNPSVIANKDDIIYTRTGQIGLAFRGYDGVVHNNSFIVSLTNDELDKDYLFTLLQYNFVKEQALKLGKNSVQPDLTHNMFKSIVIPIPSKRIQSKIAKTYNEISGKIQNNNKINAELESMAKTIYDYWFLQFEFPNENGKPYKSSGGKMVWNEELRREIPEGWKVVNLKDIVSITMGTSPKGESINTKGDGIVFYQGKADFGNRFPITRTYTKAPIRYAVENDILLSVRAPVGTLNVANERCCIGRGLAAIHSKYTSFIFYLMLANQYKFDIYNHGGTTFGAITKEDLFGMRIVAPKEDIIDKFEKRVNCIDRKIFESNRENQELISLRDFLLPLLMNGQVGFKD